MTNTQRTEVAERTLLSWQNIPHVSFLYEADVTELWDYYKEKKEELKKDGIRLTWNTIFMKLVANSMEAIPMRMVTSKPDEPFSFVEPNAIDIDIPTIFPDGKMLPVTIREPNKKTLKELANEVQEISQKVSCTDTETVLSRSNGPLSRKDIAEGTFTLSNPGSVCKVSFQPVLIDIISPQTIAIAIGSIHEQPGICLDAEGHKSIGIRKVLPLTIVFDHRAYDFGDLVPFLNALDDQCKKKLSMTAQDFCFLCLSAIALSMHTTIYIIKIHTTAGTYTTSRRLSARCGLTTNHVNKQMVATQNRTRAAFRNFSSLFIMFLHYFSSILIR